MPQTNQKYGINKNQNGSIIKVIILTSIKRKREPLVKAPESHPTAHIFVKRAASKMWLWATKMWSQNNFMYSYNIFLWFFLIIKPKKKRFWLKQTIEKILNLGIELSESAVLQTNAYLLGYAVEKNFEMFVQVFCFELNRLECTWAASKFFEFNSKSGN